MKTGCWANTDAEARKPGEQTGLDTPVVLALNDVHSIAERFDPPAVGAKVLSGPPGKYGRKATTHRN